MPSRAPIFKEMTVKDIQDYLAERQSIIVPIGIVEQHGHHLPVYTDAMTAEATAIEVAKRTGMLCFPVITACFSGGTLPGTVNINPNVSGMVIAETIQSLVSQGFRNVFLILGHGGSENYRSLMNSLNLLLRTHPAFEDVMLVFSPIWAACPDFVKYMKEDQDWHAGLVETSWMLHIAPELVRMDEIAYDEKEVYERMLAHPDNYQSASKPIDHEWVVPRLTQSDDVKIGVMGFPERANAELGKKMFEQAVEACVTTYATLEKERAPKYKEVLFEPEPIVF